MKKRILVVEDSPESFSLIERCLSDLHELVPARNLREAQNLLSRDRIDLVLLDLQLPDGDGLQLCSVIRAHEKYERLPVIVLSARRTTADRVTAFQVGTDDYVSKPFEPDELIARVGSKLKEKEIKETRAFTIQVGDLEIDQASQKVCIRTGEKVDDIILTSLELKIIMFLSKQKHRVLNRNEILDAVWGQNVHVFARNVDTHISKLRKKLGRLANYIQSAHGKGYCFAPPEGNRFPALPFRPT